MSHVHGDYQAFFDDLERTLSAAARLLGDPEQAKQFVVNARLEPFGGRTPVELVANGKVENVLRYIESLEGGFSG